MSESFSFAKYHGLGNDFLVIDLRAEPAQRAALVQEPAWVVAVCDRQFGLGADGVLALLPPTSPTAVARMRVLNSDGSEAEMCGNGIRCVARYLVDFGGVAANPMPIDTGAGLLTCHLEVDGQVTVDMGAPRFLRGELPVVGPADELARPLRVEAPALPPNLEFTGVSMGNPHVVAFVATAEATRTLAERAGPQVETASQFPKRTNVEFAHVRGHNELDLVVWERGCGITLACGTGASATAVAACLQGLCELDRAIAVHLPGGTLQIRVAPEYRRVWMTGPAHRVAHGTLEFADVWAARRPTLQR